ncbi:MAG TPA: hypothetical protein VM325_16465 [Alphaproteobacteria bacterium]|nr:hypothetical protein [Alphaproteobacteria bacterium]
MFNLKTLGGAAAIAIAAVTFGVGASPATAKSPAQAGPQVIKAKVLKSAVFICNIGRRPNIVVLRNHNNFKIPKGAKIFFVASNPTKVVAQGYRTLGRKLRHNATYKIKFSMSRVYANGRPTVCRAYAKWYA